MKKSLSFLLALALCCALTACGGGQGAAGSGAPSAPATSQPEETPDNSQPQETPDTSTPADTPETAEPEGDTGNGILIAYFTYGENAPLSDGVDPSASGGSGFSGTIQAIENAEPDATVLEGLLLRDSRIPQAEDDVADWLARLGLAG